MRPNNRILIVDDNISIHGDFKKVLSNPRLEEKRKLAPIERGLFQDDPTPDETAADEAKYYEVDSAYQGEEALEKVQQAYAEGRPYALIFMDVRMPPGWDGIETIGRIWEKHPEIEVVICTAYSDYSWEKIMLQLGTSDRLLFLRKPFDTTAVKQMALSKTRKWNLAQQSKRYVAQLENEINVRKQSEERLEYLAHHDSLTSLANRTKFSEALADQVAQAKQEGKKLGLFLVDLDRFKEINDTLGYHNGDKVLKLLARRLKESIGDHGLVARFGGDEFAIIVPDVDSMDYAAEMVAQIHNAIEPFFEIQDLQLEIRASVGIVLFPEHGTDAETLMRRADMTLSIAKKSDPRFTFYDPKFDFYSPRRLTLLGELRQAIQNSDLELYFQPKISIASGFVTGLEALVRWDHPKHGRIFPDEFVPLAERSGLIKPLSLWVLQEAPKQWEEWNREGLHVAISINLSVRDLFDVHIVEKVAQVLERHQMPGDQMVLEITESAMLEDPDHARKILMSLSRMGVKLAIDDFGTGYSSLAYLKDLPVDEIKIDKSFVLDMDRDKDDEIIVKSTIELGHTLGLSVVAEGVEGQPLLRMLKEMGCDHAQGYYMGRPIPADHIKTWLKESPWGLNGGEVAEPEKDKVLKF